MTIKTEKVSDTALEKKDENEKKWLKVGDVIGIEVEDIGTLRNIIK